MQLAGVVVRKGLSRPKITMRWWAAITAALLAALVVLCPIFFVIFRLSVFSTVPSDDYAPFLLWVLREPDGVFPLSPYCYRFLSMLAAAPLYYALPVLDLTNIPDKLPLPWIRATAALSGLAYISMVGSMLAVVALAVRKCRLSLRDGLLAGILLLLLILYTQITAIDPLAVLVICLALLALDHPRLFFAVITVSVGINEKIALLLAVWLTLRWIFVPDDRERFTLPWLGSLAAVAFYLCVVLLLRFPGHEYQLTPTDFSGTVTGNLLAYFSARGFVLNALPALILATIGGIGHLSRAGLPIPCIFRPVDLLTIPAMLGIALIFTQQFQAGRLVMHAAPLFVVPFVAALRPRVLMTRPH